MSSHAEGICARVARVRLEVAGPRGKSAFARQLGLSPSTYDYYESSRVPPADVLLGISDLAGVSLRWLITGEDAESPELDRPVLQRAGRLLENHPDAAKPLGAFVDLLTEMHEVFPAEDGPAADGRAEGPPAGQAPAQSPADAPTADIIRREVARAMKQQLAEALRQHPAAPESGTTPMAAGTQPDRDTWIPILGRSAAGVPHFWEGDEDDGITRLGDLIERHAEQTASRVDLAAATGPDCPDEAVQVITLSSPDQSDLAEFLASAALKQRYPDAFAVRIDGESMAPDIRHGDLVVLSPSQPAATVRPAVVQLHGQIGVTCKLYREDGDEVHLISINEQFAPVSVSRDDVEWALRVVAKVSMSGSM
ncbi:MAG: XRE family transcriptional regulator [Phycisphaerae bacterium]